MILTSLTIICYAEYLMFVHVLYSIVKTMGPLFEQVYANNT